jgi:hypothetical protein
VDEVGTEQPGEHGLHGRGVVAGSYQVRQARGLGEVVEQCTGGGVDDDDATVAVGSEQGVVVVVERNAEDVTRPGEWAGRQVGSGRHIRLDVADRARAVFAGMQEKAASVGHVEP